MGTKELFINGDFVSTEDSMISAIAQSFVYSTGCYEDIRGYWNETEQQVYLFRARDHFERLLRSCRTLQISLTYTVDQLIDISTELIRRNSQRQNVYLRPIAFRANQTAGSYLRGLTDHFILTTESVSDSSDITGLHCGVSSWRQTDNNAIPAHTEISRAYINSALAKGEVVQNGFDEAIMLIHDGHVSHSSDGNIFLAIDGELVTPAPTENSLLGITRDTVVELAQRELGCIIHERLVDRPELYRADEVFLCGTGAQIAPVIRIDHLPVGNGRIGPISGAVRKLYFEIVRGHLPSYRVQWCTPVYAVIPQYSEIVV